MVIFQHQLFVMLSHPRELPSWLCSFKNWKTTYSKKLHKQFGWYWHTVATTWFPQHSFTGMYFLLRMMHTIYVFMMVLCLFHIFKGETHTHTNSEIPWMSCCCHWFDGGLEVLPTKRHLIRLLVCPLQMVLRLLFIHLIKRSWVVLPFIPMIVHLQHWYQVHWWRFVHHCSPGCSCSQ